MSAIESVGTRNPINRKVLLLMLLGAVCGAALGFGVMTLAKHLMVPEKHLGWADFVAFWLGITFLGCGAALYLLSFNRRALARNMEGESATLPATDVEVRGFRLQCASMTLAGTMLLLTLLSSGTLGSTPTRASFIFAVVAAMFALQVFVNVSLWKEADEFVRGQITQGGAICFGLGQGVLFLWAAAEHLHLVAALSSWDIINLLLTLYLVTSFALAIRTRPGS